MDGVLCDFEKKYEELYNESSKATRERKLFSNNWHDFVNGKNFEKLNYFPGALRLMKYVNSLDIPVEILSSTARSEFYDQISRQKEDWLTKYGINFPRNFVPGKRFKKQFATPRSIIIDDTQSVIDDWKHAGGIGILHKDWPTTLAILGLYV